jgi:hypothetical protein
MAEYVSGMPMDIGSPDRLWKGGVKTNGILMGSVNSRVPALTEGYSRIAVDAGNVLSVPDVVPWGNALWRDVAEVDTHSGLRYAQAPSTKPLIVGVFKFNQGWQASNPIQPYGMPSYSTGTIIRQGLVGYEHAMADVNHTPSYLEYIQGVRDPMVDTVTVRTLYNDWMQMWKVAAKGSLLGLFFDDASGFPIVSVVDAADIPSPVLADCTFGGFAEVIAKEHERVYFNVQL